ncbi:hypothetical protein TNIN_406681 [Trichonephila inaurata madagascariensis]|uniref:Uncharacterized protein n=1 Tax=Trichonephila inaurata madagascariensis TaxID=2747483 RepID=A0A8X6YS45_9ARAC|nr:hypothetical protein TNIN_406681 [Trichonephila inaurata madagascariensis]
MKRLYCLLLFLCTTESSVLKKQRKREIDLSNKSHVTVPERVNMSCNFDCERTINASEGSMQIFDYPVTHQYELTYKLKIEVPKGHSIDLMFSKSQESNDTSSCGSCKPYIEIFQYDSSAVSIEERWTITKILPMVLPFAFILFGVACFWAIIKKKPESSQETQILPISIFEDQTHQPFQIQINKPEDRENRVRGLVSKYFSY